MPGGPGPFSVTDNLTTLEWFNFVVGRGLCGGRGEGRAAISAEVGTTAVCTVHTLLRRNLNV